MNNTSSTESTGDEESEFQGPNYARQSLLPNPKRHFYAMQTCAHDRRAAKNAVNTMLGKNEQQKASLSSEIVTSIKAQPHPHVIHRLASNTFKHSQRFQIHNFRIIHFDQAVYDVIRFLCTHTL